jgi:hypothetical protein
MNGWAKAAVEGAACGLMIGVVLVAGGRVWRPASVEAQAKQPAVADVVRARRLEVVDAAGKTRAGLSLGPDGGPRLLLFDASEKPRATLSVDSKGSPRLLLSGEAGKTRASLSVGPDGSPRLFLFDASEKLRASLGVESNEGPRLHLYDAAGGTRATLGTISLEGVKTGQTMKRSESSLVLFSQDGYTIWQAP